MNQTQKQIKNNTIEASIFRSGAEWWIVAYKRCKIISGQQGLVLYKKYGCGKINANGLSLGYRVLVPEQVFEEL